jgi:hypothetical protein
MPNGHGMLGIATSDLPPNIGQMRGALVQQVAPGSAASAAGLRPNDLIVAVDGRLVPAAAVLTAYVAERGPGDTVTLQILRPSASGADRLTLTVSLGGAPSAESTRQPAPHRSTTVPPPGAVNWTGFTDPNEQAFSMEVPSGWGVTGGLLRHTAIDPSIYLRVLSPDRRTYLLIGDPGITLFSTPVLSVFGQRPPEGATACDYLPGMAFARAYVAQAIATMCRDVTLTGQRERPDLARVPWTQFNPQARHDRGEVTFTCRHGGEQARGTVAAATHIYLTPGNMGGMLWSVDFLGGFIAPPDGCDAAEALLWRVVSSTRINPAWMRRQQEITEQVAHASVMRTQQTIQLARAMNSATEQMIQLGEQHRAHARERQHRMDKQFEEFDRIITGTSPYADSAGNVYYQLDNTQPYHWIGPGGQKVTTTGPAPPPGFGWQPLKEVPPE